MKIKIKRALISVSNKEGILDFAKKLESICAEIISTGGTYRALTEGGIKTRKVEEVTNFPEMMNGRLKTLHPFIHGGILANRENEKHMAEIKEAGIEPIDMVVVNLYPFKQTVLKPGVTLAEAIENIDIGGPTMIRSAAKNYKGVAVIVDPADYKIISEELDKNGGQISEDTLFKLSIKAFQHTCEYDSIIFKHFISMATETKDSKINIRPGLDVQPVKDYDLREVKDYDLRDIEGNFKTGINLSFQKIQDLRYGENPHQKAAYYKALNAEADTLVEAAKIQGKELSYNNILDADAAFSIVREFSEPCVAVIKHNNPCGAAAGKTIEKAYKAAYDCDAVSAFGSVVASNYKWTRAAAEFMFDKYVEVLIAPEFDAEALKLLSQKQNLRILKINFNLDEYIKEINSSGFKTKKLIIKSVDGGILIQDLDEGLDSRESMKVVTGIQPAPEQWKDLLFGWQIAKNVKSNAIVLVKDKSTIGIGAGQMSRIDAAKLAIEKSEGRYRGSVMASDAFFPFGDVAELASKNEIKAIIQPGGSVRDEEVIEACNKFGIPLIFTGKRHFKH